VAHARTHTQALNYKISIMQLSLRKERGGKAKCYGKCMQYAGRICTFCWKCVINQFELEV